MLAARDGTPLALSLNQLLRSSSPVLQHSATHEEGSFINIPGASWEVNGAGGYVHIADFLRYVRWATSGTIAQDPVAGLDAVAKQ